eukprot:scaffold16942_cov118-Isochrysis_galbana.AAC.2
MVYSRSSRSCAFTWVVVGGGEVVARESAPAVPRPCTHGHQLVGQLGHTGLEGRPSCGVRHRVSRFGPKKDANFRSAQ